MSEYPGESDALAAQPIHTDDAHHRARRDRQIKLALFTSLLTRPVSFLLPIITVPLFYKYLGKERYGLYEAIGALAMYIGMTNAGLSLGLLNSLTECHVSNDEERARRYTSALTPALLLLMFVGLIVLTMITWLVPWTRVFKVESSIAAREIPWSFWLVGFITLLGFLSGLPSAIYAAYQESHLNNYWDAASKVGSLIACFVVVRFSSLGILGVVIAMSGVQTLIRLINLVDLFYREKPFLAPKLKLFDRAYLRTQMSHGILLFALQMGGVLLYQSDKLIIGIGISPDDVAGYAILGRVFLSAYGVYMMLLMPLWPASGEAVRRGDTAWLRRSLRISMLVGVSMMIATGAILYFFTGPVLRHWKDAQGLTISKSLILAMTATFILRAWVDCRSTILNSANILLPQIVFYGGHGVLNVLLAMALVRRFGVEGVAWATPITALFTGAWGYPWMIRRFILRPATGNTPENEIEDAGAAGIESSKGLGS